MSPACQFSGQVYSIKDGTVDEMKIPVEKSYWYAVVILYFRTYLYVQIREDLCMYFVRSLHLLSLHSREHLEENVLSKSNWLN